MHIVEYLELFSNFGGVKVDVKFKDFDGMVATRKMEPCEILKIVSSESDRFITLMTFDDWLFEVFKYEIDPIRKRFTIHAREKKADEGSKQ